MKEELTPTDTTAVVVVEDRPDADVPCASALVATAATAPPPLADLPATLRPYRHEHAAEVRRIWCATLAMGAPIEFAYRDLRV